MKPSLAGSLPFALLALSLLPTAQGIRLNGPLARPRGGDVSQFLLDQQGKHLMYVADQEQDERFELYLVSARSGGLDRRKLNGPLVEGGDVSASIVLTPDESHLLYAADEEVDGLQGLYSVPLAGGAPIRLYSPPSQNESVLASKIRVTPDSARVVFLTGTSFASELFVAPVDGSAPAVRLSEPAAGRVVEFKLSPDGTRAVYSAGSIGEQLYSVPLDASRAPLSLLTRTISATSVPGFELTADGTRVVLRANLRLEQRFDLHVVGIEGGPLTELVRPTGDGSAGLFALAGERVVYLGGRAGQSILSSMPLDGSAAAVQLSPAQGSVSSFTVAPDGTRVALVTSEPSPSGSDLYVAPSDGSAPAVQVHSPLVPFELIYDNLRFSHDSQRLVYQALVDYSPALEIEIYSAPADASSAPARLNPPLPEGASVSFGFAFAADDGVVFRADADTRGVIELYAAPILGGPAVKLNGPLVAGGNVQSESPSVTSSTPFTVSGDGRVVAYLADQDENSVHELYVGPTRGTFTALRASQSMPIGPVQGDVTDQRFTADGRQIVYLADEVEDDVFELFLVEANRSASRRRLSMPLVLGGDVLSFELSPDGTRVAFRADAETDERVELYSVPLDGSALPVRVHAPLAADADVTTGFRFTPDSARLLFPVLLGSSQELRSASASGGVPDVRLSPIPVPGGTLDTSSPGLLVTPDSSTVLFRGRFAAPSTNELWSARVDGSLPAVRLNGALSLTETVTSFRLSPTGSHALFLVGNYQNYEVDLFSAPVDASQPAQNLNGSLTLHTLYFQGSPAFSADGTKIVFASRDPSVGLQLQVVPTDGSSAPTPLTEPAPGSTIVSQLTVVGDRALFLGRAFPLETQLFSVPLDGSAPAVRVSRSVPWTSQVVSNSSDFGAPAYRVSPDGRSVVFTCNATGNLELYAAPVDGSTPSVRLTSGTTPPSSVHSDFLFTSDSRGVLFRRDPGPGRMTEVFLVPLAGGAPRLVGGPEPVLVRKFLLSPDGRRVVTQAENASALGVLELYLSFLPPSGLAPR